MIAGTASAAGGSSGEVGSANGGGSSGEVGSVSAHGGSSGEVGSPDSGQTTVFPASSGEVA
ncbi:hypothetical protein [Glycomyces terrestris]|uniref:Uncharacterized protein n=1 Tax=Glycomyces terrestris TaxID=2493553 RepID=A0A426UXD7_9ACTN|nr:hypothetical protein [Glycomyces terrestris]RRR99168.1 hypothetical protein EIW28_10520 [Glycomyces terrestris]